MSLDETKDPNKVFLWRLGGEKPFRILLSKNVTKMQAQVTSTTGDIGQPSKNIIRGRKPADDMIIRQKKGAVLNFWDMGQILDSENWIDIAFGKVPTIDVDLIEETAEVHAFADSDWSDLKTLLFDVPVEDWPTQYRKLGYEDGELYGVDVYDGNTESAVVYGVGRANSRQHPSGDLITGEHWTETGLRYSANNFLIYSTPFIGIDNFTGRFKITSVPDPDAASVSLSLSGNVDIFLVPSIVFSWGQSVDIAGGNDPVENVIAAYRPFPRELFLEMTDPGLTYPFFTWQGAFGLVNLSDSTNIDNARDDIAEYSGMRQFLESSDSPQLVEGLPSSFPSYPTANLLYGHQAPGFLSPILRVSKLGTGESVYPEGSFCGAVKKAGTMYYFWGTGQPSEFGGESNRQIVI